MILQAWLHTYLYATSSRAGKTERPRLAPAKHWWSPCLTTEKKNLSAFTRNFGLHLLYATSDAACNARDNDFGTYIASAYCTQLSTYTLKSNRPRISYRVFTPLVVTDGHCETGKNRPTPHVQQPFKNVQNELEYGSQTRKRAPSDASLVPSTKSTSFLHGQPSFSDGVGRPWSILNSNS
jgi:hypothetical protein